MRTTAIVLVLASTVGAGCARSHTPARDASAIQGPKASGQAGVGDKTWCPVSGDDFFVTATSPAVELEGMTYYFCCPPFTKNFLADPKKFPSPSSI